MYRCRISSTVWATFAGDEARKVFNVAEGPLIRVNLLRLNKEAHVLIVVTHHILFDGWSAHVFIREIQSFYDARINNKVPLIKRTANPVRRLRLLAKTAV